MIRVVWIIGSREGGRTGGQEHLLQHLHLPEGPGVSPLGPLHCPPETKEETQVEGQQPGRP